MAIGLSQAIILSVFNSAFSRLLTLSVCLFLVNIFLMRVFVLYVMLFATVLPMVSPLGIIAHYQLNRDYIARILCENRDRPELHCDGQCYLAKRLKAQQDKQDQDTTKQVQNLPIVQLFCDVAPSFTFSHPGQLRQSIRFAAILLSQYVAPLTPVFQPPGINS
jgi:hypothetical protein